MSPKKIRTCVLYARISLATEESVSIDRQIEAGTAHAAAQGWEVVGVFRDEGVSATHNKPEQRKGWQELLASREQFDTVVIWKVDRLSRRITDFWNACQALEARGSSLAAIKDNLDLSTTIGRIVAGLIAGFAEMEAEAMSARVTAARDYLLKSSRYVGGQLPYGYRAVPNPTGPGQIIVQDDEVIDYVHEMVRRTLAGYTLYSTKQWLDEVGAPTASALLARRRAEKACESGEEPEPVQVSPKWSYGTLDKLIRHPLLAGMVPHNPGNNTRVRGDQVLLGENGLPVVDDALAVMPVAQWRAMQARLAEPTPQRAPRALKRTHSGVLSGLIWCGDDRHAEPVRMWRGTVGGARKPGYLCPECYQSVSNVEQLIVDEFLAERGDVMFFNVAKEVVEGGSVQLQEATVRLTELGREYATATRERKAEIRAEMTRLDDIQEQAMRAPAAVRYVPVGDDRTFGEDWAAATTEEERRTVLGHALHRVIVRRGKPGSWTEASKRARLTFEWMPAGQLERPTDKELATWAEYDPRTA